MGLADDSGRRRNNFRRQVPRGWAVIHLILKAANGVVGGDNKGSAVLGYSVFKQRD